MLKMYMSGVLRVPEINCNKCGKVIGEAESIALDKEPADDELMRYFFQCPHCGVRYVTHYMAPEIEEKVEQRLKILEEMQDVDELMMRRKWTN